MIAYLEGPGHNLELLCNSGPTGREHYRARMGNVGHFHLCLVIDDIEATIQACTAYDARITTLSPTFMEVDQGPNAGNRIIFIVLPDGVTIGLDGFGASGLPDEVMAHFGITPEAVAKAVEDTNAPPCWPPRNGGNGSTIGFCRERP